MPVTAVTSDSDSLRIEFRRTRWIAAALLGICALFALGGVVGFTQAAVGGDSSKMVMNLLPAVLFGSWALVALRRLRQPGGTLELSDRGIAVRCYSFSPFSGPMGAYYCAGFISWHSLAGVGLTRAWMMPCLGLSVTGVAGFLSSRDQFTDEQTVASLRQGAQSAGILWQISSMEPFVRINDILMRLMGYTGMPKSSNESDTLEWNRANWNYHILIWGRVIDGGPARLAELIRNRAKLVRPVEPAEHRDDTTKRDANARPCTSEAESAELSIEARLRTLEELFRKGLLSDDEYRRKREDIIARL